MCSNSKVSYDDIASCKLNDPICKLNKFGRVIKENLSNLMLGEDVEISLIFRFGFAKQAEGHLAYRIDCTG